MSFTQQNVIVIGTEILTHIYNSHNLNEASNADIQLDRLIQQVYDTIQHYNPDKHIVNCKLKTCINK
jgi:hypothetical protein